jgi:hydroxypyruvate isomerase
MLQLAANVSTLFTELPFLDRYDAAAAAGFAGVECQFPYAVPAQAIRERLDRHGLTQVLLNSPPGNAAAGERGIAGLPDRVQEFRDTFKQALHYASVLGCGRIHLMAGIRSPRHSLDECLGTFTHNLAYAADQAAPLGVQVLVEPINSRVDVPGYLVDSSALAVDCIRRAARPNLSLQYDVYHMQIMEGDLARTIQRLLPVIGHIQIADNPGRHEPGSGEINFAWLLPQLQVLGYRGWVGCEYIPATSTAAGLGWMRPFLEPET